MAKDLVKIIQANPGCVAIVDNDCWTLYKQHPDENPHEEDGDESCAKWDKKNELANNRNVKQIGDGYGSGNCYGGDILQALAKIVGVEIESV